MLVPALKKIYDSQEFSDFMAQRGFGVSGAIRRSSRRSWRRATQSLGAVMKAVGLAN